MAIAIARAKSRIEGEVERVYRLLREWLITRKGYLVRPITVREIVELYEYRKLLECFSAEKVAQNATQEQVAQLKGIVAVESSSLPDLDAILVANEAFHLRLAE